MGAEVLRSLNGREYLYYVYYDNGKRKEIYCGLASKLESKKKAEEIQIIELTNQRRIITKKIIILNKKIRSGGK